MEIVHYRFAIFMAVMSFMCSETAAYDLDRIWEQVQTLEDGMYHVRKDIRALFDRTRQLNMSAVEGCGQCVSGNKTSRLPVLDHDGRQNMANSDDIIVKYHSLIKAFVAEKIINRELQDQLQDLRNNMTLMNAESEKQANEREKELHDQLQDLRNNMTLMNAESEKQSNEREKELHDQLQDLRNNMTLMNAESEKQANEREKELQDHLQDLSKNMTSMNAGIEKQANEREKALQDQLQDLRNNMTVFMNTITHRIDEHLLKNESRSLIPDVTTVQITSTNCSTVPESGVYTFYIEQIMSPVTVFCDQDTDGGGWIVFMRREDGSVNFFRSWSDYKLGFGSPDGEFWAGNEFLSELTKKKPLQLRIDMEDFDGNIRFAKYEEFQVGTEEDRYRLHVRGYSGTAGDSLIDTGGISNHVGMQFTTFDSDNDEYSGNCAEYYKGGWWYNWCGAARLNGQYSRDKNVNSGNSIIWYSWKGWYESLKSVEMKIR